MIVDNIFSSIVCPIAGYPPVYPAYSTFIRYCPFPYNILNDIKDHNTSSRNRNRGDRGNIKSSQRDPSDPYRTSDSSCTRQCARSSTFIVSGSLFPIRSHGEHYYCDLKVPLRVLVESISRVNPTHYSRWYPCKSQPVKANLNRLTYIRKSAGVRP